MADPREPGPDDLACIELVDSPTESLDGELSEDQRRRVDRHLEGVRGLTALLLISSRPSSTSLAGS